MKPRMAESNEARRELVEDARLCQFVECKSKPQVAICTFWPMRCVLGGDGRSGLSGLAMHR